MAPRQDQQQQRTMDAYGTARRRATTSMVAGGVDAALIGKEAATKSSKASVATVRARGLGGMRKLDATIPTSTAKSAGDVAAKNAAAALAPAPAAATTSPFLDASAASPLGKRRVDPASKVSPPKKQSVAGADIEEKEPAVSAPAASTPRARRSLRSLSEEKEEEAAAPPPSAAAAAAAAETGVPSHPQRRRASARAAATAVSFGPGVFSSDDDEGGDDEGGIAAAAAAATAAARPARTTVRSYLSSWAPPMSFEDDEDADEGGSKEPRIEFRVGDFAYVLLDESVFAKSSSFSLSSSQEEDDGEAPALIVDGDNCVACGRGHKPLPGAARLKQQNETKRGAAAAAAEEEEEEDEGEGEEPSVPIVECSACLAGYHLDCLDPPLEVVPEAEWLCPPCERGETAERRRLAGEGESEAAAAAAEGAGAEKPGETATRFVVRSALAPAKPRTLRELFMTGKLGLVRIDALWRERPVSSRAGGAGKKKNKGGRGRKKKEELARPKKKGQEEEEETVRFRGPWLLLPEETHTGRRRGHGAREVFLSSHSCEHDAGSLVAFGFASSSLMSKASSPRSSLVAVVAEEELASTPGDDVYFCRYEYNAGFRSFRSLGAAGAALERSERRGHRKGGKKKKGENEGRKGQNGDSDDDAFSSASSDEDDCDRTDTDFRLQQPDLFDAWSRAGHRLARPASHSKGKAQTRRGAAAVAAAAAAAAARAAAGPRTDGARVKPRQGGGDDDVVVAALAGKLAAAASAKEEEEKEVEAAEEREEEERPVSPRSCPSPPSLSLSALARARAALAPSAPHCGLPCRDEERARLDAFIRGAADDGGATSGRCLYVYGVPGTGKTASVLDAVKRAAASSSSASASSSAAAKGKTSSSTSTSVRPFRFVEINALRLPTPKHVYCRLLEAMWGERASPSAAHDLLNARIGAVAAPARNAGAAAATAKKSNKGAAAAAAAKNKKMKNSRNDEDSDSEDEENEDGADGSSSEEEEGEEEEQETEEGIATIVLVDEMDLLVTRNQTVLYNLFEWPARPHSGLAVIGVANTMDLPDRLLPRIASRFGSARLPFAPYGPSQLREIVEARLRASRALEAFEPRAVLYATRKVAAMAGDVRRALELCRMATDVAADEAREERRKARNARGKAGGDGDGSGTDDDDDDEEFDCDAPSPSSPSADSARNAIVVSMRHVDAAVRAMFGAAHMQALSAAPLIDVLFLAALALELKASGRAAATVADIAPRVAELFASGALLPHGSTPPTLGDVAASASRLAAQRILVADAGDARARARVAFDVPVADVLAALRAQRGSTAFVARLPYV